MAENSQDYGFYKENVPKGIQYFTQQWLNQLPSSKAQYLYGWQPKVIDRGGMSFNYPLAYLNNVQPTPQLGDEGRYHWASKTYGGQWLKEPTHATRHYEDEAVLRNQLDKAKMTAATQQGQQGGS